MVAGLDSSILAVEVTAAAGPLKYSYCLHKPVVTDPEYFFPVILEHSAR